MFIWDFLLGTVMDQFIDWIYGQVVGFLGDFFAQMGNMGVELCRLQQSIKFIHYEKPPYLNNKLLHRLQRSFCIGFIMVQTLQ